MVRGIRGWLRKHRRPERAIVLILAVCLLAGCGLFLLMGFLEVAVRPIRLGLAVLLVWPLFLGLLRWQAAAEFRQLDSETGISEYVRNDDRMEMARLRELLGQQEPSFVERGFSEGFSRMDGPEAFFVMIVLFVATCGVWLLWDLIRMGPTLLTEMIIDADLVAANPALLQRFSSGNWFKNAMDATAIYFFGLSMITCLLMVVWLAVRGIR